MWIPASVAHNTSIRAQVQAGIAKLVLSEQSHPQHHKRKRAAVIYARFTLICEAVSTSSSADSLSGSK